jgi:glycosyltransferase involved in cell wall biosynthesis
MRIAQVAPLVESIPPSKYGGTERIVAALTTELVSLGHEVTVYASGDSNVAGRLIPIVEEALWKRDCNVNENVLHLAELARVAREAEEYDIIHSHLDYLAFPFAQHCQTPVVHTMHGRLDMPELHQLAREYPDLALVSISDAQRRPLPHANWLATVYNGTSVDAHPMGSGDGDYLAFLGRISPEKGLADAIDIAVRAGMPLRIAARMPLENVDNPWVQQDWTYYRDEIKPRLSHPLIELVGEVDDAQKAELLKHARALLFPINWPEPFGLAMVEALAFGTPVIARSGGSVPEVIRDGRTGFICETNDEMVEACKRIDSISRADCRADAEERFSERAMAVGYLDVYRGLLGEPLYSPPPGVHTSAYAINRLSA